MLLQIVIVSTREGRKGDAVARWFETRARAHGAFDVELVDLAEVTCREETFVLLSGAVALVLAGGYRIGFRFLHALFESTNRLSE
jgi:hypothetical protein